MKQQVFILKMKPYRKNQPKMFINDNMKKKGEKITSKKKNK